MTDPTVYLAGPIHHKPDDGAHWRRDVQMVLEDRGYNVINPLTAVEATEATIDVVGKDLDLIDDSDALFVNWEHVPMAGTPMEIRYCFEREIPVIVCVNCPKDDLSGWVQYHATELCSSLGQTIDKVDRILCDGCGNAKEWVDGYSLAGEPSGYFCRNEECAHD